MSEENRVRYIVANHQNQPIELHLLSGVVVLEPRGEAVMEEADLASPQLQVLRRNRLIRIRQGSEPRPAVSPSVVATPLIPLTSPPQSTSQPEPGTSIKTKSRNEPK